MAMQYRLRFASDSRPTTEVDLYLCHDCLWTLCDDSAVELVGGATGQTGLDPVHPE